MLCVPSYNGASSSIAKWHTEDHQSSGRTTLVISIIKLSKLLRHERARARVAVDAITVVIVVVVIVDRF